MKGLVQLYSGVTAGVQLLPRAGALWTCVLTAAAATATAKIYNNTSATGNPLVTIATPANQSVYPDFEGLPFGALGLFVVVTGAGAELTVTVE